MPPSCASHLDASGTINVKVKGHEYYVSAYAPGGVKQTWGGPAFPCEAATNESQIRTLAADVLAGIAPEVDLASVGDTQDLREALDLDSMGFANFVIGLGERTGLKIPEADNRKLYTMQGLVAYLAR